MKKERRDVDGKRRKEERSGVIASVIFFTKMRVNGDGLSLSTTDSTVIVLGTCDVARELCLEKSTLASGGLLVFDKTRDPAQHFFMRAFNCDGSEETLSGNGARCLAGLAFQSGIAPREMTFGFSGGIVHATVDPVPPDPSTSLVTLDMGGVDLDMHNAPDLPSGARPSSITRSLSAAFLIVSSLSTISKICPLPTSFLLREGSVSTQSAFRRARTSIFSNETRKDRAFGSSHTRET